MNVQFINAGNCIICGREIKVVAKRGNNKFTDIIFCPRCEGKIKKSKSADKIESED